MLVSCLECRQTTCDRSRTYDFPPQVTNAPVHLRCQRRSPTAEGQIFFQGKEYGDFCNLFERFWWLNCLMVFGGLKIDENVVGAYLFDGVW